MSERAADLWEKIPESTRRAISDALNVRRDQHMMTALYGRAFTNANIEPTPVAPPLTIEAIERALELLPAQIVPLSSVFFPAETAWQVKARREHFFCAHPAFWAQAMSHPAISAEFPAPIVLDIRPDETELETERRRDCWRRLSKALLAAQEV